MSSPLEVMIELAQPDHKTLKQIRGCWERKWGNEHWGCSQQHPPHPSCYGWNAETREGQGLPEIIAGQSRDHAPALQSADPVIFLLHSIYSGQLAHY